MEEKKYIKNSEVCKVVSLHEFYKAHKYDLTPLGQAKSFLGTYLYKESAKLNHAREMLSSNHQSREYLGYTVETESHALGVGINKL